MAQTSYYARLQLSAMKTLPVGAEFGLTLNNVSVSRTTSVKGVRGAVTESWHKYEPRRTSSICRLIQTIVLWSVHEHVYGDIKLSWIESRRYRPLYGVTAK